MSDHEFLRNHVPTCHQHHVMRMVLDTILNWLTPGGWLIIGAHENVPLKTDSIRPCGHSVWRKVTVNA